MNEGHTGFTGHVSLHHFGWRRQAACHRRRRCDIRIGKIHLAGRVTHAAFEVAVARRDAALAAGDDAHVSAETRAARWRADGTFGIDKDVDESFMHGLLINFLRARDDHGAHPRVNLAAAQHLGGGTQISEVAIGAHADDDLMNFETGNF